MDADHPADSLSVEVDRAIVTWTRDGGPAAGGTLRGNPRLLATVERIYLDSDPDPIPLPNGTVYRMSPRRDTIADIAAAMLAAGPGRAIPDHGLLEVVKNMYRPMNHPDSICQDPPHTDFRKGNQ